MVELVARNDTVSRSVMKRDEAVAFFRDKGEEYKAQIIEDIPANEEISLYRQGEFIDLCRGPHVPETGRLKAFKLTKVVITSYSIHYTKLYDSYYDYYQPEAYVPATDTYIEKDASINEHIEQMRLSATKALLERHDAIIVATVSAIYGLGDPAAYHGMILHLRSGMLTDQRAILRRLAELQYTRNDLELRNNFV